MVITVTCPSCSASFPVDPAKIPQGGVNARCSSCGDIFRVEKPAPEPALPTLEELAPEPVPAPPVPPAPAPAPPGVEVPAAPPVPEPAPPEPTPPPPPAPPVEAAPPPPPAAPEPPAAPAVDPFAEAAPFEEPAQPEPAEAEPVTGGVQGFTFGKRDPTDKARRLARVLVSDMIMYNAERHQSALAAGTLVQDFEEEIEKSWKEFVEQVGEELANASGRQFWKDALNDILAKGEQVF